MTYKNLLDRQDLDLSNFVTPRLTAILVPYEGSHIIKCFIKDTDFNIGDMLTLVQDTDGSLFLVKASPQMSHVVVKNNGLVAFNKNTLKIVSDVLKIALPKVGKPMRVLLNKVAEKEWKL
jgi:hypothetical protein